MTASPQDAPSADSLPSSRDAEPQESLPAPSEASERHPEAAASMGYVDHWFKVADKIAIADRQVVSDLHVRVEQRLTALELGDSDDLTVALRRLAKVEKRAKRDRRRIRHLEAMLDELDRRQA